MDARWDAVAGLAARQNGLVTRAQCLEQGLCRTSLDRAVRGGGRWQRVLPGVYATFTGALGASQLCRAALLYAGASALLAGRTALQRYGLRYLPPDDGVVHVLVPHHVKVSSRSFVRVHRTRRMPTPRRRDGFALSPPEHAALLTARQGIDLRDARALLAEVVQRRLTTVERLERVLASGPSAGSCLPRQVLRDLAAGCRSGPEIELRHLIGTSRLLSAGVRWNHPITLDGFVLVADSCWPEVRLVMEVDSIEHHGLGWGPELTSRRRVALVADGWTVLSVSPYRIRHDGYQLIRQAERTYERLRDG